QLSGDTDLISIRSRASSRRPFTKVNEMEEQANRRIRDESAKLQNEVAEANRRLGEIQANVDPSQQQILSAALRDEQEKLRGNVIATQKEQRRLQKEARGELNWMITKIKLWNIVVIPLLVAVVGIVVFVSRRARTSAR
ncbi:MAG: hypothetical protein P8J87_07445, partial [Verrucomicrobiales bacterium]|nr:hypothetical protein [Verrucomicrobiales bacterium]